MTWQVYYAECPENNCLGNYTGETGRRLIECILDHEGRYSKSHTFWHAFEKEQRPPTIDEFEIIDRSYKISKNSK